MVPIYESDVAEERWSKSEWNHYELWEKVEQRVRRHNRIWIAATAVVFLLLSSVPIVIDQRPHWTAISAARRLGQEITRLKRGAAVEHTPLRLRFDGDGRVSYRVERVESCGAPTGTVVETGTLIPGPRASEFRLLSRSAGESISIPGLLEEFCYDPIQGSAVALRGEATSGFAIAPVNDLSARRLDRVSVLLITGPLAEPSFE